MRVSHEDISIHLASMQALLYASLAALTRASSTASRLASQCLCSSCFLLLLTGLQGDWGYALRNQE